MSNNMSRDHDVQITMKTSGGKSRATHKKVIKIVPNYRRASIGYGKGKCISVLKKLGRGAQSTKWGGTCLEVAINGNGPGKTN